MRIAVYPGSFDPITNGHLDIIERASRLYDRLVVGVLSNGNKNPLFSAEERVEMIRRVTVHLNNVEVDTFTGLLVDFAKSKNATVIVKGLRTVADFEYEFQMALLNKALNPEYETMFMMTNTKYSYISSSMVKELAGFRGNLTGLVPSEIIGQIKEKYE
ncbi:MAG: pantetheine-phosphate adenylyltransferase [Clostridia bacterium]|nr:pantetheine-phosphate adenylyltransferase [Clostridia bacterium]MCI8979291.1 pantetheine-phosphate adenylyltransferase [Clostridia bacterium]MCI9086658.1 pantetheine-phosphate adenylyltransferase [Clostridia bacterium]NDO18711.1 pantetheine-phosphate adenylyltransferase [Lachnospiraceae bacterium MD329]